MSISKEETEIIGKWVFKNNKVVKNSNCDRINALIKDYLQKVATDETGWKTLYQDPNDKRYWELIYFEGELQGGGPPSLINIGNRLVKYNIREDNK